MGRGWDEGVIESGGGGGQNEESQEGEVRDKINNS